MAHRYRLYPVPGQMPMLVRHCDDARAVWNLALEQWNCWRRGRKPPPGSTVRFRQLAEARKDSWLGEGSSSVQQQALRDFDQAVRNFFAGTHSRPRWRCKGIDEGFCIRDVRVERLNRRWATVFVPKCGAVRFRLSRPLPAEYGMARITWDRAGRWHVSFTAPQPPIKREPTGKAVGVDLGVAHTITMSDPVFEMAGIPGPHFDIPALTPGEAQRKRRLERQLARQRKDSRRREATKLALGRLKAREADRRKDFVEKVTTGVVRSFDLIAIEDLKVKQMMASASGTIEAPGTNVAQKRGLNRSIGSQGWAMFRQRLTDKAATCGIRVVAIDPSFTSLRCAACGHTEEDNRDSQALFSCRTCGHEANADVNASENILAAGLAVTARGGTPGCGPSEARTLPERLAA
jgi:IS605 OrfB family transposase